MGWLFEIGHPIFSFFPLFFKSDKVFRVSGGSAIRISWFSVDLPVQSEIGHPCFFEIGHPFFPFFPLTFFVIGQGFPLLWSVAIPNILVLWQFSRPIWDRTMKSEDNEDRSTDFVLFRDVILERGPFCPSFFHFFWDEVRSHKKCKKEGEKEPRSKLTPRKQTKSVALWSDSCGARRLRS